MGREPARRRNPVLLRDPLSRDHRLSTARPHVLLVEDSPLVVAALQLLLEETGHRVSVAGSIADAVALAEAQRVDVMLLDLSLPDGDGLAVLDRLRERDTAPTVSVAMTGRDDPVTRERCLTAGCRDVLIKPVPTSELVRRIAGWTGKPSGGG